MKYILMLAILLFSCASITKSPKSPEPLRVTVREKVILEEKIVAKEEAPKIRIFTEEDKIAMRKKATIRAKRLEDLCDDVKNNRHVLSEYCIFKENPSGSRTFPGKYLYREYVVHPLKDEINAVKKKMKYETWPGKGGEMKKYFEYDFKKSTAVKDFKVVPVEETSFEDTSRQMFRLEGPKFSIYITLWTSSMSTNDAQESIARQNLFMRGISGYSQYNKLGKAKLGDVNFIGSGSGCSGLAFVRNNVVCTVSKFVPDLHNSRSGFNGKKVVKEDKEGPTMKALAKEIDAAIMASPSLKKGEKVKNKYDEKNLFKKNARESRAYGDNFKLKQFKFPVLKKYKLTKSVEKQNYEGINYATYDPIHIYYEFKEPLRSEIKITFSIFRSTALNKAIGSLPELERLRDKHNNSLISARKRGYNFGSCCFIRKGEQGRQEILFYRGQVRCHIKASNPVTRGHLKWLAYRLDLALMGQYSNSQYFPVK